MHRDHPVRQYRAVIGDRTQLVDVREPHEVAEGTLPDARNIPLAALPARIGELDPGRPVALVCRSGGRSTAACELLTGAGFHDVINLAGGMLAWNEGDTP